MTIQPFKIVETFEDALADYTGFTYAVAVNSCTNALAIALEYSKLNNPEIKEIEIPKHTYVSVPIQIKRAGYKLKFSDQVWEGAYRLDPLPIWDSARRFYYGMNNYEFIDGMPFDATRMVCVSFHKTKILGHTQGGAILTNDNLVYEFAKQMRFDGRTEGINPKYDEITVLGMHCYMCPGVAAELLHKLYHLPRINPDLPNSDYPDLSKMAIFQED